jgi:hypothetical protein
MYQQRDAIEIREYERKQLVEYLRDVVGLYQDKQLDDRAEATAYVATHFEGGQSETTEEYDLGHDIWAEIVQDLSELDDNRSQWLRAKIARRAGCDPPQMGYTTSVPIGTTLAGRLG